MDWARWGTVSALAGFPSSGAFTSGIQNGNVTVDIREPCLFLLVPPTFELGIRLLVAFLCIAVYTQTHTRMYVCY